MLIKSFKSAFRGMVSVFKEENNFRIQIVLAIFVVVLMFFFNLSSIERGLLVLMILIVLVLEMLNSVIERFIDVLKPRVHTYVRDMKDIAAGSVLLASIGAILIGIIIFYPHIKILLTK